MMGEAAVNYWITEVDGEIKGELKRVLPPVGGSTL